jgi:hypothetical protein
VLRDLQQSEAGCRGFDRPAQHREERFKAVDLGAASSAPIADPIRCGESQEPFVHAERWWFLAASAAEPENPDAERQEGERCSHLEIIPEADFHLSSCALNHDEVGDRAEHGEITGKRRRHCQG